MSSGTRPGTTRTISIVIPSYNYAQFLPGAVDSALGQREVDPEVIVVDDGSIDDTLRVLERYGADVRVLKKENGGHASALNAGFALSTGAIVLFLDADDLLYPDAARRILAYAQDGAASYQWYLDIAGADGAPSGHRIPSVPPTEGDLRSLTLQRGPGCRVCPPASGLAWSRTFLRQVMPIPETVKDAGAEPFLVDAAPLFGTIVSIPEALGTYRIHANAMHTPMRGISTRALDRVLRSYEARRAFLAHHAGVSPGAWERRNWRIEVVRLLRARRRRIDLPALGRAISAALSSAGGVTKRAVIVGFVLTVGVLPRRLSYAIARRVIHPEFM
jgi:glycosyltransferase involved in cell wall biosynthesis